MAELLLPDESLVDAIVRRAGRPDFARFEAQLKSSGYCARPVRLKGWVEACDGRGGRKRVWDTTDESDGDSERRSAPTDSSEDDSADDESDSGADAPVVPLPTQADRTSEP